MGVGCTFSTNIKAIMGCRPPAHRLVTTSLAGEALAKALVLRTAAEQTFFFSVFHSLQQSQSPGSLENIFKKLT